MDLGATIYKLRTAKNLSQEELAGLLDVSRQSVSKWETNAATPDLEKLIKLCDIFDVSLDELAGRSKPEPEEPVVMTVPVKNPALTQRKIVGYILLAVSLAAALLFIFLQELFYGSPWLWFMSTVPPMFCCSLVCLSGKPHAGYRCFWLVCMFTEYLLYEFFMIPVSVLPLSLWDYSLLLHVTVLLLGLFAAHFLLRGILVPYQKKRGYLLLLGWVLFPLLSRYSLKLIYSRAVYDLFGSWYDGQLYFHSLSCVLLVALLAVLFTATVLHLRGWRDHRKTKP